MQRNYLDRIGSECMWPNGVRAACHNVAADGVCTDCGDSVAPDVRPEPYFLASSNETCREVAQRVSLVKPDFRAVSEDFNGTLTVTLPDGSSFLFGTANMTWGGDYYAKGSDDSYEGVDTGVSEEEQNLEDVARAIVRTIKRFKASQEFLTALSDFKCAAFALNEAWQALDKDDHDRESLCNHYPFKESFDETVYQIEAWQEDIENDPAFGNGKRPKK